MSQFRSKRNKYDLTFSKFILLRDPVCQWCLKRPATETSHIFSRKNMAVRCYEKNAFGACNYCHRKWHSEPLLASEWCRSIMGEKEYIKLMRAANTPTKMTTFEKDFVRREQVEQIKQFEKGQLQPVPFTQMFARKVVSG